MLRGAQGDGVASPHHAARSTLYTRLGAASALACALACGDEAPPAPPPPEVLVVEVVERDVPVVSEWLGTTEGSVDADIRTQVSGYLISRDYEEGQKVTKGDLLFRIDPRSFRAALDQARGDLGRAQAELERARLDVARYTPLVQQGAVSRQEYDNAVQRQRGDEAAVQAARAAVEKAEIELSFAEIRSPIEGIVGVAKAQLGDFVSPNDPNPLTTVSQLDPIRVVFQVSEQEYLRFAPRFQKAIADRNFRADALQLVLADGSIYPHLGTGYPAGREIDPRTGTITVKGVFPNPEPLLRPGQYARVRVETDLAKGGLVVPQRAIQDLQGLAQLAVVGPDEKVEVRTVETGPSWGTLQVITKGVAAGERVVVEGFQKVRPGMVVRAKPAPAELAGAPSGDGPPPDASARGATSSPATPPVPTPVPAK
jgi:membrane fusion protein (multidrug efflux system)